LSTEKVPFVTVAWRLFTHTGEPAGFTVPVTLTLDAVVVELVEGETVEIVTLGVEVVVESERI